MNKEDRISAYILNNQKGFLIFTLFFSLGVPAVLGWIFYITGSISFLIIGSFLFLVTYLVFEKKFRKPFSYKAQIILDRYSISIVSFNSEEVMNADFNDIKQFRTITYTQNDFTQLHLVLGNNKKMKFVFWGQENVEDNLSNRIINLFRDLVLEYNRGRNPNEKISVLPDFWATKKSLYLLWSIVIILSSIVIYFSFDIPLVLFSFLLIALIYIGFDAQRKIALEDKELFSSES